MLLICWKLDSWLKRLINQKKHFCLLKLRSQILHFWHCCISLMIKSRWIMHLFINRLCTSFTVRDFDHESSQERRSQNHERHVSSMDRQLISEPKQNCSNSVQLSFTQVC
jgi:hypothetical protein